MILEPSESWDPHGKTTWALPPEDYEKLPAGTVEVHKVSEGAEERYVLDAIIGEARRREKITLKTEKWSESDLAMHNINKFLGIYMDVDGKTPTSTIWWFGEKSHCQGMKSTQGGIGVENLQGSGLIAGETSRAYQDGPRRFSLWRKRQHIENKQDALFRITPLDGPEHLKYKKMYETIG